MNSAEISSIQALAPRKQFMTKKARALELASISYPLPIFEPCFKLEIIMILAIGIESQ
jgi:hypothetical protein